MSQPQELKITESRPRYAEFNGQAMSDLELLALLQKGYSIRQGHNKQGHLMFWLQLPLERRVAVDPAQLQRFKRLGWVQPVQSTTGTIWELNRQPQPQPPANSKVTPIGSKRLPRTKSTQVVDDDGDEGENGDDRHGHPTPATANPNPCVRLFGPGPEGQTCKGCIYLLAVRAGRVYYKCRKRSITSSASTDHRQGWQACAKYQSAETAATTNTLNQPTGDRGQDQILNNSSGSQPAPFNTNTNLGA